MLDRAVARSGAARTKTNNSELGSSRGLLSPGQTLAERAGLKLRRACLAPRNWVPEVGKAVAGLAQAAALRFAALLLSIMAATPMPPAVHTEISPRPPCSAR